MAILNAIIINIVGENPKSEYLNPKQYQMFNKTIFKTYWNI